MFATIKRFLKVLLFSLIVILGFQGSTFSIMAESLNVDNVNVPEIKTKRDKALRVLRVGTIVTIIGVGCIAIGTYSLQNTPSEIFPTYGIGEGMLGMSITTIGLTVSIIGIVKVIKEHKRKEYSENL